MPYTNRFVRTCRPCHRVDRAIILREVQLSAPENATKVGTLTELLDSLVICTPQRWSEKRDALCGQLPRALNLASKKLLISKERQPSDSNQRSRHSRAGGNPGFACASGYRWIPACAGMTVVFWDSAGKSYRCEKFIDAPPDEAS